MILWMVWFLVAVAVIATKHYTARTLVAMRLKLSKQGKTIAFAKSEEKVIKNNIAIAKRSLSLALKNITENEKLTRKLKQDLQELEEEVKKEMEGTKRLIALSKDPWGGDNRGD